MKTNMKGALTLITAPMLVSGLSGVFDWQLEDGMVMLFGFSMIAGLVWAWVVESNR